MKLAILIAWALLQIGPDRMVSAQGENLAQILEQIRQLVLGLESEGLIDRKYQPYLQEDFEDGDVYDFIVVGAGSAGSALVRRLTEIKKWKILLLEAGDEPDVLSEIPIWSIATIGTRLNWNYTTEIEPNLALGFQDRVIRWHRGKGIGGTSLLNFMVMARGTRQDYDLWAAQGNPGWSFDEVLPYLKRLEDVRIPNADWPYRGRKGPISVEEPYVSESGHIFIEAGENSGFDNIDYNGRTNEGISVAQAALKNGLKCNGELCYIRPVKNRKNLTIRLNSQATKVLFKNKRAHGVQYSKDGQIYTAYATKEIILSAGAINSPQILLLSGIGPKDQLEQLGIEPIVDLPVGQKVLDHAAYFGLMFTYNDSTIVPDVNSLVDPVSFIELYNYGEAILRSIGTFEGITYTRSPLASTNQTDIELIYTSTSMNFDPVLGLAGLLGVDPVLYQSLYLPLNGTPAGACIPVVLHPKSSGRVELRSSDPFVHPKMYSGYFTDPEGEDMKTMIEGIRECIRVMQMPPFDRYGATLAAQPVSGCGDVEDDSNEYWECAVRHLTAGLWHQTMSCKMGPRHDPEAVVDNKLRVYGVKGLRVVDTSIVPTGISGHLGAVAYMVAEKAADIIKRDYTR